MRFFNVAGPCDPELHYMVPAAQRLPGIDQLLAKRAYFVLHAPRQTGKTTTLRALAHQLTAEGRFAALHFSCEAAASVGDDIGAAEDVLLAQLARKAEIDLPEALRPTPPSGSSAPAGARLTDALTRWARTCPRPLVLFMDEVDALRGPVLRSVLSQLRAGHDARPENFPHSVALCGLRDVREYKLASGGGPVRAGSASPFNIKQTSIRLGNFSRDQIADLYLQHTREGGVRFSESSISRAFSLSGGQPWLVNALARELVEDMGLAPGAEVLEEHVDAAKERLVRARATHLDSLLARLREPRVRRVLEPLIAGELTGGSSFDDDFQYVVDLGLVEPELPVRISNPIYREVVLRVLALPAEAAVTAEPRSYVDAEGKLDVERILKGFAEFWTEHGEVLEGRVDYPEAAPQLVLMAWLQRVVNGRGGDNGEAVRRAGEPGVPAVSRRGEPTRSGGDGGGVIEREVGVGRKRIDLLIRWPYEQAGRKVWQREAMELKVWRDRDKKGDPKPRGLAQLDAYLDRMSLDTGTLVVFDSRGQAPPVEQRTRLEWATTPSGRRVRLLQA